MIDFVENSIIICLHNMNFVFNNFVFNIFLIDKKSLFNKNLIIYKCIVCLLIRYAVHFSMLRSV